MTELILEVLGYLGAAALIGIFLGYLFWGWGQRERIASARADGAARARTSGFGDPALTKKVDMLTAERDKLARSVETLQGKLDTHSAAPGNGEQTSGGTDKQASADPPRPMAGRGRLSLTMLAGAAPEPEADPHPTTPADVERKSAAPEDENTSEDAPDPSTASPSRVAEREPEDMDDGEFLDADIEMLEDEDVESQLEDVLEALHGDPNGEEPGDDAPSGSDADDDASSEADDRSGVFLSEPPSELDDLKKIRGVGAKMEGLLNDHGVFLFRQIARFGEDDIEWLNRAIAAFPGRIRRDNWVEQARTLHAEKYGQPYDVD